MSVLIPSFSLQTQSGQIHLVPLADSGSLSLPSSDQETTCVFDHVYDQYKLVKGHLPAESFYDCEGTSIADRSVSLHSPYLLVEEETALEMVSAWSSAANGRPQLSYAERLRKAKEGSLGSKKASASDHGTGVDAIASSLARKDDHIVNGNHSSESSHAGATLSAEEKLPSARAAESSTRPQEQLTKANPPNAWEARKKQSEEKVHKSNSDEQQRHPESQSQRPSTSEEVAADNASASNLPQSSEKGNGRLPVNVWQQRSARINAAITSPKSNSTDLQGSAPSAPEETKDTRAAKSNGREEKGVPGANSAVAWPSPDAATSSKHRDEGTGSVVEGDVSMGRGSSSKTLSVASTSETMQRLDVQVLKSQGSEKQRKGKHWIAIVPTITHNAPSPSPGKKRGTSKASNSMPAGGVRSSNASVQGDGAAKNTGSGHTSKPNVAHLSDQQPMTTSQAKHNASRLTDEQKSHATSLAQSDNLPSLPALSGNYRSDSAQGTTQMTFRGASLASYTPPLGPPRSPIVNGSIRGPRFSSDSISSPSSTREATSKSRSTFSSVGTLTPATDASPQFDAFHINDLSALYAQKSEGKGSCEPSTPSMYLAPAQYQASSSVQSHRGRARGSRGRGKVGSGASSSGDDSTRNGAHGDVTAATAQSGQPLEGVADSNAEGHSSIALPEHDDLVHASPRQSELAAMPSAQQGNEHYQHPPAHPYYLPLEQTPVELAPIGSNVQTEPTLKLLHQMEFYFSHRNLQGDFFLRKSMDSYGFVPIDVVSKFKKVRSMTEDISVIRQTLQCSRVLHVDLVNGVIRKAFDWQMYVLVDGNRPQQPLPPPAWSASQSRSPRHTWTAARPPYSAPSPSLSKPRPSFLPPIPPSPHSRASMGSNQPRQQAFGSASPRDSTSTAATINDSSANADSRGGEDADNGEDDDDDEDDDDQEVALGVVAATGLGGTLQM